MLNQKLLNSYSFNYIRGDLKGIHRNLSNIVNLTDALISVGYKKSSTTAFNNNYDLETNIVDAERPRIKLVDYHYIETLTNNTTGSLLSDTASIVYE